MIKHLKSLDTGEMSKNINDASLANLKHFEGKWKHGTTKTIRVPIALADDVLAYAKQLDNDGDESHSTHTVNSSDTSDIPDAADLLNQLKSQSKKSKATLADVELLLSLIFT